MRRIGLSEEQALQKLREGFEATIRNFKTNSGKFEFSAKLDALDPIDESKVKKPIVIVNSIAWLKMITLVLHNKEEIAWQSCVEVRNFKDSEETYYYIKNVYVYPQTVTGTHVDMDELEYAKWSMENLSNDEYNTLRFQGHSHVNMGVGPSGIDEATYQKFLDQLQKDEFYIFVIMNKRMELTALVYDYKQNIIFETKDVTIDVLLPDGKYLSTWLAETDKMLKHPTTATTIYPKGRTQTNDLSDYYDNLLYGGRSEYVAPTKKTQDAVDKKITNTVTDYDGNTYSNVSELGYSKNNIWHYFDSDLAKIEFFEDFPQFITDYLPRSPHIREELRVRGVINRHGNVRQSVLPSETTLETKKRGRPPKGAKK